MIFFYSTFKKLMVPLIPDEPISGRDLRKKFNKQSGRTIGAAGFYLWMHKLQEEGIVSITDVPEVIDGIHYKKRIFTKIRSDQ